MKNVTGHSFSPASTRSRRSRKIATKQQAPQPKQYCQCCHRQLRRFFLCADCGRRCCVQDCLAVNAYGNYCIECRPLPPPVQPVHEMQPWAPRRPMVIADAHNDGNRQPRRRTCQVCHNNTRRIFRCTNCGLLCCEQNCLADTNTERKYCHECVPPQSIQPRYD